MTKRVLPPSLAPPRIITQLESQLGGWGKVNDYGRLNCYCPVRVCITHTQLSVSSSFLLWLECRSTPLLGSGRAVSHSKVGGCAPGAERKRRRKPKWFLVAVVSVANRPSWLALAFDCPACRSCLRCWCNRFRPDWSTTSAGGGGGPSAKMRAVVPGTRPIGSTAGRGFFLTPRKMTSFEAVGLLPSSPKRCSY